MKYFDYLMSTIVLCFILWVSVPSSLFLDVKKTDVSGYDVRLVRTTPFGEVSARWRSEIQMFDTRFECTSGGWATSTYQEIESNVVEYTIGDWADACIELGTPYTLHTQRQVMLFGLIPIRSVTTVDFIDPTIPRYP